MAMENIIKNAPIKLKIILLGDSGVGKTSLIHQYVNKKFQNKPILDFKEPLSKAVEVNNKHVILQIHDTGGREREGAGLEAAFFSDAKGCMLVYDVNDPKTSENLENWYNEFITRVIQNRESTRTFPFIVLGNKADTDGGRNKEVHQNTARKWCESKGIAHLPTSAKDNKSVAEAFMHVVQLALNHNFYSAQEPHPPLPAPSQNLLGTQNGSKPPNARPPSIPQNKPTNGTQDNPKPPPHTNGTHYNPPLAPQDIPKPPPHTNGTHHNPPLAPQDNPKPPYTNGTQYNPPSAPQGNKPPPQTNAPQDNHKPPPHTNGTQYNPPPARQNNCCCTIL